MSPPASGQASQAADRQCLYSLGAVDWVPESFKVGDSDVTNIGQNILKVVVWRICHLCEYN